MVHRSTFNRPFLSYPEFITDLGGKTVLNMIDVLSKLAPPKAPTFQLKHNCGQITYPLSPPGKLTSQQKGALIDLILWSYADNHHEPSTDITEKMAPGFITNKELRKKAKDFNEMVQEGITAMRERTEDILTVTFTFDLDSLSKYKQGNTSREVSRCIGFRELHITHDNQDFHNNCLAFAERFARAIICQVNTTPLRRGYSSELNKSWNNLKLGPEVPLRIEKPLALEHCPVQPAPADITCTTPDISKAFTPSPTPENSVDGSHGRRKCKVQSRESINLWKDQLDVSAEDFDRMLAESNYAIINKLAEQEHDPDAVLDDEAPTEYEESSRSGSTEARAYPTYMPYAAGGGILVPTGYMYMPPSGARHPLTPMRGGRSAQPISSFAAPPFVFANPVLSPRAYEEEHIARSSPSRASRLSTASRSLRPGPDEATGSHHHGVAPARNSRDA